MIILEQILYNEYDNYNETEIIKYFNPIFISYMTKFTPNIKESKLFDVTLISLLINDIIRQNLASMFYMFKTMNV